ncbi:putative tRNA (cytidine(34)-2'-O)-methyltransferase [Rhodamnia argentea]|uniref:tRNA (Cytidine(34)-2'-O)-methyltransferase n=1 Tax=Rhodamnia argentea TaxID=178133 RepID=A0A8B8QJY0_9MYRT|nr:putative tRNA (cytidine(34)-2'-O)-methyltransferase [Rhodamnia argentea]
MDTRSCCSMKTLSGITPFHLCFRSRPPLLRPPAFALLNFKFCPPLRSSPSLSVSPLSSLSAAAKEHGANGGDSLLLVNGKSLQGPSPNKFLQVVLVSPQIPGNTGCIARTCAASAIGLHLVGPLGFQVDDSKLKRAGLDYWPYVVVKVHNSWAEFRDYFRKQDGEKRLLAFTKRGTDIHSEFSYRKGDWLVFGSETSGLSNEVLLDCRNETYGGGTIRIPMIETYVRCLNLSVSVGIALYEACRQLNYAQLQSSSSTSNNSEQAFITEDIFA